MRRPRVLFVAYYLAALFLILFFKNRTNDLIVENSHFVNTVLTGVEEFQNFFPIAYMLNFIDTYDSLPTIYVITPTYNRLTQIADLTRLKNTLQLVPKVVWIIVEDSLDKTDKIINFVFDSNLKIVHLVEKTLPTVKPSGTVGHKGVEQRNRALKWLKESNVANGAFYFADDDNSYDIRLFEEIRSVERIGVWPVGLVGGIKYEAPICKNNKVIDWFFVYNPRRYFPTDMASFALNVKLLHEFEDIYFERFTRGDLEGVFLKKFQIKMNELEPKANNCSKIYVWHTRTRKEIIKSGIDFDKEIMKQI
ncbi:unnamed protein product [Brachionus calyciflorus]|uniref:Galactosylgalactosylxylosylprotein 3-beta-glucuronosyltransferase n=1 Tax=Brachionus calyciflorus TaxID=104777 RepID=A0A813SZC5_9BILA|nr:unnamed protein product [Brachionus calyciflorus]